MGLISELKRRNILRVAGVYAVVGWVLVQVAGALEEAIGLPMWFDGLVVALLLVGFPVAMVLTWAFEMTPQGVKRTQSTSSVDGENGAAIAVERTDIALLVGIVAIIGIAAWQQLSPSTADSGASANIGAESASDDALSAADLLATGLTQAEAVSDASIAVLPFADLSPGKDQSHFSDGIAEEILNVLVRIESLKVASRTSAFGFKGQEALGIPLIAEKLNVRHILEGSVRKSGDSVRITAQLIDARTDVHLWSETFDRELTTENIFAVQDEIAAAIAAELGVMIGEQAAPAPRKATTENLDAYEIYLKAKAMFHVRGVDTILEIVELYEQAVELDPTFAEAWAGLAAIYLVVPGWDLGPDDEFYPKAREAADRATALDAKLSLPFSVRGGIDSEQGDMVATIKQMDIALRLEPKNIQAIYFRAAIMIELGFFDQAEKALRECLDIDPSYQHCSRFLSFVLLFNGEPEVAAKFFEMGVLKGQDSFSDMFWQYYGAIGDTRALALAIATTPFEDAIQREMSYRLYSDPEYSFEAYNADRQVHAISTRGEPLPDDVLTADGWAIINPMAFFWSPYELFVQRPELRDQYQRARKKLMIDRGQVAYWRANGFPPQCRAIGDDDFECDVPSASKQDTYVVN